MIKSSYFLNIPDFKQGVNTSRAMLSLGLNESPGALNVDFSNDGVVSKRYGAITLNAVRVESNPSVGLGMYDYGVIVNPVSGTILLLHCNGTPWPASNQTLQDSSPMNWSIMKSGGGPYFYSGTSLFPAFVNYVYCDTDDYSEIPEHAVWNMGSGDFSFDCRCDFVGGKGIGWIFLMGPMTGYYYNSMNGPWGFSLSNTDVGMTSCAAIFHFQEVTTNSTGNIVTPTFLMPSNFTNCAWQISSSVLQFYLSGGMVGTGKTLKAGGSRVTLKDATNYKVRLFRAYSQQYSAMCDFDELCFTKTWRWGASFDAPTSQYKSASEEEKRLMLASGTGVYYSRDMGGTWSLAQTSRSSAINHFALVKQNLINTNDSYDAMQYWAGTEGAYFLDVSTAAPKVKYVFDHQGYALGLNEQNNKNSVYYIDNNELLTGTWDNFALPTAKNDEITGGFILNKNIYVSTKYKLFKMMYVGGNPDWSYYEVKDWGFVPNTIKKVNLIDIGEVVIGLDYARNIRMFDGTNDRIITEKIDEDNGVTPFYMKSITEDCLNLCWAENDVINNIYRLFVPKNPSRTVDFSVNFNYRSGAFGFSNNQKYNCGVLVADTNGVLSFMVCNSVGLVGKLNTGNTDFGVPIDDYYISPFLFNKRPNAVQKLGEMSLYFLSDSCGTINIEDRKNFGSRWGLRKSFDLVSGLNAVMTSQSIDIPETVNVYQFKVSSSANTANPWTMLRMDLGEDIPGYGRP